MNKTILTQVELKRQLSYDSETGVFVRLVSNTNAVKVGEVSGSLSHGYLRVMVNSIAYEAHRLAWFYAYGEWVEMIDHINGIKHDNRLCNLRSANYLNNNRNAGMRKDNASGYKGVSYRKDIGKWRAQYNYNKKRTHLGFFDTALEASLVYERYAKLHYGDFHREVAPIVDN